MYLLQQIKEKLLEISFLEEQLKNALFSLNNEECKITEITYNYASTYPIHVVYQDLEGTTFCSLSYKYRDTCKVFKKFFNDSKFLDLYYEHEKLSQKILSLYYILEDEIKLFSEKQALSFFEVMKKRDNYQNNIPMDKEYLNKSLFMFRPTYYFYVDNLNLNTIPFLEEFFNFDKKFFKFEIVHAKIKNKNKLNFYISSSRYVKDFNIKFKPDYFTLSYSNKREVTSKCKTFFLLDEKNCNHIPEEFNQLFELNNF